MDGLIVIGDTDNLRGLKYEKGISLFILLFLFNIAEK